MLCVVFLVPATAVVIDYLRHMHCLNVLNKLNNKPPDKQRKKKEKEKNHKTMLAGLLKLRSPFASSLASFKLSQSVPT